MASSSQPCPPLGFSAKYYTVSNSGQCVRQSSFFNGESVLNQGVGYSVILGFGAFFAVFTSFLVWLEKRYVGSRHTSEWFNTAGRNVKTGLIASVIVSQWTWAATILQSSNVAWEYGISGPFWYASGATIQVLLFGVMAIEIKRKAPQAHTVCEIVKARWGTCAHIVFLSFCFLTNIIVTAMLLLGGSAVVNALTGVNIYAASFLIPLGVIVYTLAGGLKATFLASYIHSVIVHIVLVIFVYLVYTASSELGSPRAVYTHLLDVASKSRICKDPISHLGQACGPVNGNYKGSYLTMLSSGGLVFGIINIVGNFGTVFVDNGYWVSAIAARPSSTHKGYLLGGLVWFAVPFSLATSLGLGALALDLPLTSSEASHGLVPPAMAIALMGKGGSVLLLTMLFMAVTSAGSSELIAVSSLCTYDIYRTYINPNATGKQILKVSRGVVLGFGCFMGVLAVMLNKAGVSLGWMYLAMGVLVGSAVMPIAFMLLWRKANSIGAILGTVIGCILGIIAWLAVASIEYGRVNLDTTGRNAPMLAGNLVSILTGGLVHAVCSVVWPQNYDWETTRMIKMVEKVKSDLPDDEFKDEKLLKAKSWIVKWGLSFTAVIVILWPLLSLPAGNFSVGYFTFWVVIAIAWGTIASAVIIILPLAESWKTIQSVCIGMFTNDRLMEKIDEMNSRLRAVMAVMPEADRIYFIVDNAWDHNLLHEVFGDFLNFDYLASNRACCLSDNRWVWYPKSRKHNLTSMVYSHFNTSVDNLCPWAGWSNIWQLKIAPRPKYFIWLLLHNGIKTYAYLYNLNLGPLTFCKLCNLDVENSEHLFNLCPKARLIWHLVSNVLGKHISFQEGFTTGNWLCSDHPVFTKHEQSVIAVVSWLLWKARCNIIFRNESFDPHSIIIQAINHVREFSLSSYSQLGKQLIQNNFSFTDSPFLFVSSIGSSLNGTFGAGFYLTDSHPQFISAGCCCNLADSALEADALALVTALGSMFSSDIRIKTVFFANAELLKLIEDRLSLHDWRLYPLIVSISDFLISLGQPQLCIIPQEWFSTAHSLAIHGLCLHDLTLFHQGRDLPHWLMKHFIRSGISV